MYDGCAESTTTQKLETTSGTVEYKYWCPCYDADGSSVGSKEHAVFSDVDAVTCTDCIQTGVAASEVTATSSTNCRTFRGSAKSYILSANKALNLAENRGDPPRCRRRAKARRLSRYSN